MIEIDQNLLDELLRRAETTDRMRVNYDLRTSEDDKSQRMLNALLPGTIVSVHRHNRSNENIICLKGKLSVIFYDDKGCETERHSLNPSIGKFGCVVPAKAWHCVDVHEPSVIYEAKDGPYGQDGTEQFLGDSKKLF